MEITITLTEEEFKMIASSVDERQSRLEDLHQSVKAQEHENLYYKLIAEYVKQNKR